jgi:Zn finger protein HypA/HybF involved in hydrogenase expression
MSHLNNSHSDTGLHHAFCQDCHLTFIIASTEDRCPFCGSDDYTLHTAEEIEEGH